MLADIGLRRFHAFGERRDALFAAFQLLQHAQTQRFAHCPETRGDQLERFPGQHWAAAAAIRAAPPIEYLHSYPFSYIDKLSRVNLAKRGADHVLPRIEPG